MRPRTLVLCALAWVALLMLEALFSSPANPADAPPLPAKPAPPPKGESYPIAAIVIGVDGEPLVIIFVSDTGERLAASIDQCKASPLCLEIFAKLRDAKSVDKVNLRSGCQPDTQTSFSARRPRAAK